MDICKSRFLYTNEMISLLNSKKVCNVINYDNERINISSMLYTFDCDNDKVTFYLIIMTKENPLNKLKDEDSINIFLDNYISDFYLDAYQSFNAYGTLKFITQPKEVNYILQKFRRKYIQEPAMIFENNPDKYKYIKVNISDMKGKQF